jgi:hypothetical protein
MLGSSVSRRRAILLSAGAIAAVVAVAAMSSDAVRSYGFSSALEISRPGLVFRPNGHPPGVGDEGYWLTRAEVESPTTLMKALAVGDRITISGPDGRERRLEVVDLKLIGGDPVLRTGATIAPMRLLAVTCKALDGEETTSPVRFIIEVDPAAPAAPAPSKAL